MGDRIEALAGVVGDARSRRAQKEAAAFDDFLRGFDLVEGPDSLALYITALEGAARSGRQIRDRIQLIDLARRLRGLRPLSGHPDVRVLLLGLHSRRPVGEQRGHYDPLYLELVLAMVDACLVQTKAQLQTHAALLLRDQAGLSVAALSRLKWRDVRLTKQRVDITTTTTVGRGATATAVASLSARPGDPGCPVAAVRALRPGHDGDHLFSIDGKPVGKDRLGLLLTRPDPLAPMPAQIRDPALLLIGFGAGLRTNEAKALRQSDVRRHDQGLILSIAGRRRLTYLPSSPNAAYDAASAWSRWMEELRSRGLNDPDGPLFRVTNFSVIFDRPMQEMGLNRMIHQRAEEAGLAGRFVWTSLRTGMMRTAVRKEARAYSIAAHADLLSLGSVQRHERRENLLGEGNVAGRLGL